MKLAKRLLALAVLGLPGVVNAQVLPPKVSAPPDPGVAIQNALEGMLNPHYKVLERPTPVYRQPADTMNGRYVFKLAPGTRVYIRKGLAAGFLVTLFYGDREVYYLPIKEVVRLPTYVEI